MRRVAGMSQTFDESPNLVKGYLLFKKVDAALPDWGVPSQRAGKPMEAYQCRRCNHIFFSPSNRVRESWRRSCKCHLVSWRASPLLPCGPTDASHPRTG